jgi:uncharacterized membrane protein
MAPEGFAASTSTAAPSTRGTSSTRTTRPTHVRQGQRRGRPYGNGAGDPRRLARGLGWFSIGLGVAELVAPRQVARLIGSPARTGLLRALGMREIASGLGILSRPRPAGWLWSRVVGDAMDLALLGAAYRSPRANPDRIAAATAAVAGVTALDVLSSSRLSRTAGTAPKRDADGAIRIGQSIAINRSSEECYRFWRDLQNLPRIMRHLESVQPAGDNRSRWVAKAPAGMRVEWTAEIVDDRQNELIMWRSIEGSEVNNSGWVRFSPAPGGRGTYVTVEMRYMPPAGQLGAVVLKLLGKDPEQQVHEDLRRFKQLLEAGEIATNQGAPSAQRSVIGRLQKGSS